MHGRTPISSGQNHSQFHLNTSPNSPAEHSDGAENSHSALPNADLGTKERDGNSNALLHRVSRSNDSIIIYNREILSAEDISTVDTAKFQYMTLETMRSLSIEKIAQLIASQIKNIPTSILESMTPQQVAAIHPQTWKQLDSRTHKILIHYRESTLNNFKKQQKGQEFIENYDLVKSYLITLPGTHLSVLEDKIFDIFEPTDLLQIITPEKMSLIAPEKFVKICKDWNLLTPQHIQAADPKVFALASASQLQQLSLECRGTLNPSQLSQVNLNVVSDQFLLELPPQQVQALDQRISQVSPSLFSDEEAIREFRVAKQREIAALDQFRAASDELDSLFSTDRSWPPEQAERITDAFWEMEMWRMRYMGLMEQVRDDQGRPLNAQVEFEASERKFQTVLNEATQESGKIAKVLEICQEIQNKQNEYRQFVTEAQQAEERIAAKNQAIAQFMLALDGTQIAELTERQLSGISLEAWSRIQSALKAQAQSYAEREAPAIATTAENQAIREAQKNRENTKPVFTTRDDEAQWIARRRAEEVQWIAMRTQELKAKIKNEEFIRLAKDFFEKFRSIQFSFIRPEVVNMWKIPGWGNILEVISLSRMLSFQSPQNYSKAEIRKILDAVLQDMKEKKIPFLERLTLQQIDWITQDDDGNSRSTVYSNEEIQAARKHIQENGKPATLQQLNFQKLRSDQLDGVSRKAVQDFLRSPGWIDFVSDELLVAIVRKYVDDKALLGPDFYIQCAQNRKFHIIPTELRQKIDPSCFKQFTLDNFWEHLSPFISLKNNLVPTQEQFWDVIRDLKSNQLAECLPLFKVLLFEVLPFVPADQIHGVPAEAFRYLGEWPLLTSEQINNMELHHFSEMSPKVFAQLWNNKNTPPLSSVRPKILKQLPLGHYSELFHRVSAQGASFSQIWTPKQYQKLPDQLFFKQMISLNETPRRCLKKLTGSQFSAWLQGQPTSPNFNHSLPLKTILKINPHVFACIGNKGQSQVHYLPTSTLKNLTPQYYQALYDHVRKTGTSFNDLWANEQLPFLPSKFFSDGWMNPEKKHPAALPYFTSDQWDAWLSNPDNDLKWLQGEHLAEFHGKNLSAQFLSKLSEDQMQYIPLRELAKIPREVMQQFIASTPEEDNRIKTLISEGIVKEKDVRLARESASNQSIADTIRQTGQNPDPATVQIVKEAYQKAEQVQRSNELEQKLQALSSDVKILEVEAQQQVAQKAEDPDWILLPGTLEKDNPEATQFHQKTQETRRVVLSDQNRINNVVEGMKTTFFEFSSSMRAASQSRGGKLAGLGIGVISTLQFWLDILSDPDKFKKLPMGLQLHIYWNVSDLIAGWVEDGISFSDWTIKKFHTSTKDIVSFANNVTRKSPSGTFSNRELTLSKATVQYFAKKGFKSLAHGIQSGLSKISPYLSAFNRLLGGVSIGTSIGDLSTAQTRDEKILAGTNLAFSLLSLGVGYLAGSAAAAPLILAGISINIVVDTKLGMDRAIKQYQSRADEARDFLEIQHRLYEQPSKHQGDILFFQNARLRKIDLSNGEIITNSQLVHTLRMRKNQKTGKYEHYYLPSKKLATIYGFSESTTIPENEVQRVQIVRLPDNTKQENLLIEEEDTYLPEQRYAIGRNYPPTTPEQKRTEEILKNQEIITGHLRSLISRDQHPNEKDVPLCLKAPAHRDVVWVIPFEAKDNKASYELETHAKGATNVISYYAHGINLKLKDPKDVITASIISINIGDAQLFPEEGLKVENRDGKKKLFVTHDRNRISEIDISGITDSVIQIVARGGIWNIYPNGEILLQGSVIINASDETVLKQLGKEKRVERVVGIYPKEFALNPPSNSYYFNSNATRDGVTTQITKITTPKTITITTRISGRGTANPHGGTRDLPPEVIPTPVDDPIHQKVQERYNNYLRKLTAAFKTTVPRVFVDGKIIQSDRILPGAQFIEDCESKDYYFFFHAETGTLQRIKKSNYEESRCQLPVKNGMPTRLVANGEQISFKYVIPYGTEGKKVTFTYQWTDEEPQLRTVEGVIVEQESANLLSRPTGMVLRNLSIKIPDAALADILKQAGIEQPIGRPQTSTRTGVNNWIQFIGQDINGASYNFDANLKLGQIILLNKDDRLVAELSSNTSKGRIYYSPKERSLLFVKLSGDGEAVHNSQQPIPRVTDVREITHVPGANSVCLISADGKQITLWNPLTDTKVILPSPHRMEMLSDGIPRDVPPKREQSERRMAATSTRRETSVHSSPLLTLRV